MRGSFLGAGIAVLLLRAGASAQQPDLAALVAAARQALGGAAALGAVQSFAVKGTFTRNLTQITTTATVEISCVLPDKFVRVMRRPMGNGPLAGMEITDYDGFNGTDPIRATVAPNLPFPTMIPGGPAPTTPDEIAAAREKQLNNLRRLFVEGVVPLFVSAPDLYGIAMTAGGTVPLDRGQADAVDMTRSDGTIWRLLLDETTHLPVKMLWQAKPVVVFSSSSRVAVPRGQMPPPPSITLPSGDPTAGMATVEWQMVIGDYKVADGLHWPHRFTTSFDGKPWEDLTLDKFKINPKIDPKTFDPRKSTH